MGGTWWAQPWCPTQGPFPAGKGDKASSGFIFSLVFLTCECSI